MTDAAKRETSVLNQHKLASLRERDLAPYRHRQGSPFEVSRESLHEWADLLLRAPDPYYTLKNARDRVAALLRQVADSLGALPRPAGDAETERLVEEYEAEMESVIAASLEVGEVVSVKQGAPDARKAALLAHVAALRVRAEAAERGHGEVVKELRAAEAEIQQLVEDAAGEDL